MDRGDRTTDTNPPMRSHRTSALRSATQVIWRRWQRLWILPLLALLLTGCFDYDLAIRFHSSSSGELVQHLQVNERLGSFRDTPLRSWVDAIAVRSQPIGGQIEVQPQELRIRIPFSDAADLETKFNQFFDPTTAPADRPSSTAALPAIPATLTLHRSNALLVERNQLHAELDLRSLGVAAGNGTIILSPVTRSNLAVRLETPWGSWTRSIAALDSTAQLQGSILIWKLTPGNLNQLDLVFWMPNAIGTGALAIGVLVLVGILIKQRQSANLISSSKPPRFSDSQ